jgi:hypothetical protein
MRIPLLLISIINLHSVVHQKDALRQFRGLLPVNRNARRRLKCPGP